MTNRDIQSHKVRQFLQFRFPQPPIVIIASAGALCFCTSIATATLDHLASQRHAVTALPHVADRIAG